MRQPSDVRVEVIESEGLRIKNRPRIESVQESVEKNADSGEYKKEDCRWLSGKTF